MELTDLLGKVIIDSPTVTTRLGKYTKREQPWEVVGDGLETRAAVVSGVGRPSAHPVRDLIQLLRGRAAEAV